MSIVKQLFERYGFLASILLLGGMLVYTVLHFSLNIPLLDDYEQVLGFLINFQETPGLLEKLQLLVEERNEHRALLVHGFAALDQLIFGEVNFRHFILLILLTYAGIIHAIWRVFERLKEAQAYFVPIVLLLTVPMFLIHNWTCAGLIYLPSVLLSLWAFLALDKGGRTNFILASICAVVATANFAGGVLAFICAVPILLNKYTKTYSLIWGAIFVSVGLSYFIGFSPNHEGQALLSIQANPLVVVANFFLFFGPPFKYLFPSYFLGQYLIGLLMVIAVGVMAVKHWTRILPILQAGLLLALGLGGGMALLRSHFGLGSTLSPRYELFQLLLPVFIFLTALSLGWIKRSSLYWITGILFLFALIRWPQKWQEATAIHERMRYGLYSYQISQEPIFLSAKASVHDAAIIPTAEENGIYALQQKDVEPQAIHDLQESQNLLRMKQATHSVVDNNRYWMWRGWAFLNFRSMPGLKPYLKLYSDDQVIYWPSGPHYIHRDPIQEGENGFVFFIDKMTDKIPTGNYSCDIVLVHPRQGIIAKKPTKHTITIAGN